MKQTVILKNKLFLYLTEFFAGMSVMAVELGASRLLAPYFSSSQIVWTIVIGAESGPPVHENPDRCDLDRSDSGGGQIYRARNLGTFDFYGEQ